MKGKLPIICIGRSSCSRIIFRRVKVVFSFVCCFEQCVRLDTSENSTLLSHHPDEKPHSMAGRNIVQMLKYPLLSDSLWHILFFLALYVFTNVTFHRASIDWIHDGPLNKNPESWFTIYSIASGVLRIEIIGFFAVYINRLSYETKRAIPAEFESENRVRHKDGH